MMKRVTDMVVCLCLLLAGMPAAAQDTTCMRQPGRLAQLAAQDAAQWQELQEAHGSHEVTLRTRHVFERLVHSQAGRHIRWHLMSYASRMINAHAMHDGGVVISAGLDAPGLPDDAVAAGLAHEIAHVLLDHTAQRACLALQLASAHQARGMPQVWSSDDDPVLRMRALMHAQELQADAKAVELLRQAGFAQRSMSGLLRRLSTVYASEGPPASGSHPDHQLRILKAEEAESTAGKLPSARAHSRLRRMPTPR
jgi:predicted Zn-dependent protease